MSGDARLTRVDAELQCGQTGWSRRTRHPQPASHSRPGTASAGLLDLVLPRDRLQHPVQQEEDRSASSHPPPPPSPPPPPPPPQLLQRRTGGGPGPGQQRGFNECSWTLRGQNRSICLSLDSVRPGPAPDGRPEDGAGPG